MYTLNVYIEPGLFFIRQKERMSHSVTTAIDDAE